MLEYEIRYNDIADDIIRLLIKYNIPIADIGKVDNAVYSRICRTREEAIAKLNINLVADLETVLFPQER